MNKFNQFRKGEIKSEEEIHPQLKGTTLLHSQELLEIRIGIHSGPVTKEVDFDNRENIWGAGMNISARVASLAEPNQIVVSKKYYEDAGLQHHKEYKIQHIGEWWAKHNISIELYNVRTDSAGIPSKDVDVWYKPFHYPLAQVIETYSEMINNEVKKKNGFRAFVLAKRLLDIDSENRKSKSVIKEISKDEDIFASGMAGGDGISDKFFSKLSFKALSYFCSNTKFQSFEKEETIFKQGEKADSMMIVVSGELQPYMNNVEIPSAILPGEGHVIGEMGLFNPAGKARTTTLKALKNSIALSMNYEYLEEGRCDESEEIRQHLWKFYCKRTSQNYITTLTLFDSLEENQIAKLWLKSGFLPERYNQQIEISPDFLWDSWIIVVAGRVTVKMAKGDLLEFEKNTCIGPVRALCRNSPYREVSIDKNTHIVYLPWGIIEEFLSASNSFRKVCFSEGGEIFWNNRQPLES